MATSLTLLCCAATASVRAAGFPGRHEPLDAGGADKARRRSIDRHPELVLRSPARAADETALSLALDAAIDERLRDMDFGAWAGRSLEQVDRDDPAALARWIAQPHRGTPGGETLAQVRDRVRPWLDGMAGEDRTILAITHASTIRAILCEALDLPDEPAMRFDIAPLSGARLSFHRGWRLQRLGPVGSSQEIRM